MTDAAPILTLRARVSGRVQGVWFRNWTRDKALRRGISGWVRNEADGSVTALLSGPEPAVREMVAALRDGPPLAQVARVDTAPAEPPRGGGFEILG